MPMIYKSSAEAKDVRPPPLTDAPPNAFLGDVLVSNAPKDKTMSAGFFRLEKGEKLIYTYTYDEMKIFLEVEGEYTITDEIGKKVVVSAGDCFYFNKGCTITFETTGYGVAFYTGLRETI